MHNNRLPQRVKMVWDRCPNPILPHWVKCRHYGFSSNDIGRFSDDMVLGVKSYMMKQDALQTVKKSCYRVTNNQHEKSMQNAVFLQYKI